MGEHEYHFDLHRILLGDDSPLFLLEIAARTVFIFLFTLVLLRCMGKRGMGSLTPFEFAIIVALGSAVGDPMFQADVPLVHCMLVITLVVGLQRALAFFSERNKWAEKVLSSTPTVLIVDGVIQVENLHRETFTREELLEELRLKGIEQLGEVRIAYLEASGNLSVLRREHARDGLSVEPDCAQRTQRGERNSSHACCGYCGRLAEVDERSDPCSNCGHRNWVGVIEAMHAGDSQRD